MDRNKTSERNFRMRPILEGYEVLFQLLQHLLYSLTVDTVEASFAEVESTYEDKDSFDFQHTFK